MNGPTHPDDPGEPSTGIARIGVTPTEADLIAALCRNKAVLEIGTGLGTATRAIAEVALSVDTVDIDPWVHERIHPVLTRNAHYNIRCHAAVPAESYDIVFVDADHRPEAVRNDLTTCREVCPAGTWIFHDATELREANLLTGDEWTYLPTRYGLAIRFGTDVG